MSEKLKNKSEYSQARVEGARRYFTQEKAVIVQVKERILLTVSRRAQLSASKVKELINHNYLIIHSF